jgi:hypothetical protein
MLKNYLILTILIALAAIANGATGFCSSICKPNSCTNSTPNGCTSCDTNFTASGTTCIPNPLMGWSQVDVSDDLSGSLIVNTSATATGICGTLKFFGNYTPSTSIKITSPTGILKPFYQIQLIYWVLLIDWWDGWTVVSTTFDQINSQKNSSKGTVQKATLQYCGQWWIN